MKFTKEIRAALELVNPNKIELFDKLLEDDFFFEKTNSGWHWVKGGKSSGTYWDNIADMLDAAARYSELPKRVPLPDFRQLITYCMDAVKEYEMRENEDSDIKHYIYEEAMMAVFGRDVFDKLRKIRP